MGTQELVNILYGLVTFFGGMWVKGLADSMKDLKATDIELAEKVQRIEVLVAGEYVTRSDFDAKIDRMFQKLDAIENKLDGKVNKMDCNGCGK